MKEATAYMMTDMLKSVITAGLGYNANISGLYHAGKTGTSNYADNELKKLTKDYNYSSIVTPDESFVGYTTQYSMAVWTGYTNRLTPVLDDGIKVATDVYKQMMLYTDQVAKTGPNQVAYTVAVPTSILIMVRTTTITTIMSQAIQLKKRANQQKTAQVHLAQKRILNTQNHLLKRMSKITN